MTNYLDFIREQVAVFDGAMATNLQSRNLSIDDFGGQAFDACYEMLAATRPAVVADVHCSFLDLGVDVIETNSFGALPAVLDNFGIADRAGELALLSAQIARDVASSYATRDRPIFVAGSIGPGSRSLERGEISLIDLRNGTEITARALLEGGVDLLLVETAFDVQGAEAALTGCRRAMHGVGRSVPLQVHVTTSSGAHPASKAIALTSLGPRSPDVIGLNCSAAAEMYPALRDLSAACRLPISAMPSAGLPFWSNGVFHYDLAADELANQLEKFVAELGVSVIGGCCGTTPEHLARVVERFRNDTPPTRTSPNRSSRDA